MKEKLERLKAIGGRAGVAAVMIATPFAAHAEAGGGTGAVDLSAMTNSISFAQVGTAILAVAASLALIYVGVKGAKIVLGFIRG